MLKVTSTSGFTNKFTAMTPHWTPTHPSTPTGTLVPAPAGTLISPRTLTPVPTKIIILTLPRNPNPYPDRNPAATPDPNPDNSTADCTHLYPRQDLNPSCNITPELDHCPTRNSYPYQNHAGDPVPNPCHNSTPNCTQDLYPGRDLN